jgi:hypothetical protein
MTRKPAKPGARRKSQQKGAVWERCVSEWLKRLKAAGVLTAFHKLEPTKIGERFVKDAGADFVCCTSSGSYIAIECKATDQDRFKRSEVSQVQAAHLDAVPLSFLALRIGDEMFFVPWRAIPWETLRTAESVTADRLRAWEVRTWMGVRECLRLEIADGT